eukprot:2484779-Rhodomonas_salina.2
MPRQRTRHVVSERAEQSGVSPTRCLEVGSKLRWSSTENEDDQDSRHTQERLGADYAPCQC